MELVPNGSEQPTPVVFDMSQLDERLQGGPLYLNFLSRRTTFGEGNEAYDLTAACDDGIDEEGTLNMQLLATIESTLEHVKGHDGEPVAFVQTVSTDAIKKIDATIGVLAPDGAVIGKLGYDAAGGPGLSGQGVSYSLSAHNGYNRSTVTVERSIPLERSEAIVPFYTHEVKIGQPYTIQGAEVETVHEVIVGNEIIPWIKTNFGETEEAYGIYIGFLQALRANGAEAYLNDEFFLRTLAREQQVEKMARRVLKDYIDTAKDLQTLIEANRIEAERKLQNVGEFAGDLLPVLQSVRNSEDGLLDKLGDKTWAPDPAHRIKMIDWRLKHVDPGSLELPVLE